GEPAGRLPLHPFPVLPPAPPPGALSGEEAARRAHAQELPPPPGRGVECRGAGLGALPRGSRRSVRPGARSRTASDPVQREVILGPQGTAQGGGRERDRAGASRAVLPVS